MRHAVQIRRRSLTHPQVCLRIRRRCLNAHVGQADRSPVRTGTCGSARVGILSKCRDLWQSGPIARPSRQTIEIRSCISGRIVQLGERTAQVDGWSNAGGRIMRGNGFEQDGTALVGRIRGETIRLEWYSLMIPSDPDNQTMLFILKSSTKGRIRPISCIWSKT